MNIPKPPYQRALIYVSGAYRGPNEDAVATNIAKAREAAKALWQAGWTAVCPHLNTAFMGGVVTDEDFLEGDFQIVQRCDAIYMLSGYLDSHGAMRELQHFVKYRPEGRVYHQDQLATPAPVTPFLIGITGIHGVGKDTLADYLYGRLEDMGHPVTKLPLALPMKAMLENMGVPNDNLFGPSANRSKPCGLPGIPLTTRELLEKFGTDAVRNHVHEDFWIAAHKAAIAKRHEALKEDAPWTLEKRPVVLVPDVRFLNELAYVVDSGGVICDFYWGLAQRPPLVPSDQHLHEPCAYQAWNRKYIVDAQRFEFLRYTTISQSTEERDASIDKMKERADRCLAGPWQAHLNPTKAGR